MRRLMTILLVAALAAGALWTLGRRREPAVEPGGMSVSQALGGVPQTGFARAVAPRAFRFPADHGPHPEYKTEWWYFTGNLADSAGRRFGYQLTFFRMALAPGEPPRSSRWATNQAYMAHFALTDVNGRRFSSAERFSRAALGLAGAGGVPLEVFLEDWSARETKGAPWSVRLRAAQGSGALDLELVSAQPVVLNGERGLSRKGPEPGNASYYYSIPRLATRGTLSVGGERFQVTGTSWLDREWSTSALSGDQAGWDWFALQLKDGRDLMYYQLRKKDGSADPFSAGTLVAADGSAKPLTRDQVRLVPTGWWKSPHDGARYPAGWRLSVPGEGIALEVVPRLSDQELLTSFRYWEGAVAVKGEGGAELGSGYLEMTGYQPGGAGVGR
ncbi:carotenoid 1,2-hydratase [Geomonas silvestris]|uniref:Carotenoid 1,2-hydratase n=1 Tax=Geomonas silvestris TaxID=2740184 RepID=A0A6V8MKM3_9BACT|nr:lipocalin-like domain-containing protein [Geomonas silvestris]GFO60585.1 carotenoid 1,2-hydratase [Geomonas silvestris]